MPHTLHQRGTIFGLEDDTRHAHWIAKEEALVQHLACTKRRQGRVPGEAKQRDALSGCSAGRLVVVGDILRQRPVEVCRSGHGYETAGANLLDNIDEARIRLGIEVPGRIERVPGWTHNTKLI